MAKKKTENIKAAPVLRGDQPTPTPEQTGTRTYQIMDPWKDRGVVNLVDVKAVDGAVTEVKVNGQPAGGGGGGDFSTAKVTVIMEGSAIYDKITAPLINGNQATGFGGPRDKTTVFTVILYKGTAIAEISTLGGHLSVSGNITITDESLLKITGDGTVTLS